MNRVQLRRAVRRAAAVFTLAIFAFAFLNMTTDVVQAQVETGAFTLRISEKEKRLQHPESAWDTVLMSDTASQREDFRNMPYLELTNTSTIPITQFHLTIGDPRFNFAPVTAGQFAVRGSTTPGFSLTSETLNGGDELVVDIENGGLAAGQTVRFKINLDIDSTFAAQYATLFRNVDPDYRTVLFDMNGKNVYESGMPVSPNTSDNALAWAIFDPATGPDLTSTPEPFEDYPVAAANLFNTSFRGCCCVADPVLFFELDGVTPPSDVQIPEPAGASLAVVAMMSGLFFCWRSRRAYSRR
jgi:hypothetical protein